MPSEVVGERLTVPALVRRWADEQPDRAFVVTDDDALTYGELERRSAALRRSSSPYVSASSAVTTNARSGCSSDHRRTSAGTVRRSLLIEELLDRLQVGLATGEHREVGRREHEEAAGHLVRR